MLKLLLPALLLSAGATDAAFARNAQPDVHISYHDLDLRSQAGITQLDRRINRAINAVCPDPVGVDLQLKLAISKCRRIKAAEVSGQRIGALASATRADVSIAASR
ncbi:UrcA family protein [Sphingomonas alpina]|uniref:UrcA family protein n=1 Tax=Sphingomonas alpina TaxID=653931 RepID=A0A7H0LGM8_9SPHN|nr:UrcA family protein [Sphingomonas alpina]QNQ08831.1 UrcA family protein [Sphingomonas alpina]